MKPLESQDFLDLKADLEAHKRVCGYYIIKFVDITELRAHGKDEDAIAEDVFQCFDDQQWPPIDQRPRDLRWADYRVERAVAREHVLEQLVGGPSIGHGRETIPRYTAELYFDRFEALFDEPRHYYIGMGFGDRKYVFLQGVAVISRSRAGVLWIVESD